MMSKNQKEHQLLALLYKVEEILMELGDDGKFSEEYKNLMVIINNLEKYLRDKQDLM